MNGKTPILAGTLSALVALSAPVFSADDGTEKCYGVARAGKNDCASGTHACAGHSSKDGDAKEWVKLPKGTCERIVGGTLNPAAEKAVKPFGYPGK